jgi:hypothetical protein
VVVQGLRGYLTIDEKWFFLTQKSENYYFLPDEDEPHRTCKSKNYIPRIMFFVSPLDQDLEMDNAFLMENWLFSSCDL